MIDLNHIARYQENNRIEAKKAAGGFPQDVYKRQGLWFLQHYKGEANPL